MMTKKKKSVVDMKFTLKGLAPGEKSVCTIGNLSEEDVNRIRKMLGGDRCSKNHN